MKKISAEIVADSIDPRGNRITSFLLTFPRFILAELNTHRVFSRNSASNRAIPFEKMVKMVEEDPFIPVAWQKHHTGMQGDEYLTSKQDIEDAELEWLSAKTWAVDCAKRLYNTGVTKQLCNRLLEPYMWHQTLITATEFENFFELRCPKYEGMGKLFRSKKDYIEYHNNNSDLDWTDAVPDATFRAINKSQAEIHIQALAESMWDAMNESQPSILSEGEWHIPFGDRVDYVKLARNVDIPQDFYSIECSPENKDSDFYKDWLEKYILKVSTSRCARLSYNTHGGEIDYEKDIQLHDKLLDSRHLSPFEHCARVMTNDEYETFIRGSVDALTIGGDMDLSCNVDEGDKGWCNNFKGFIPYRYLIENNYD